MSKNSKNSLKLGLLLIALVVGFFVLKHNRESRIAGSDFKKEFLSSELAGSVDEVFVKTKDGEELRFKKDGKIWFVKNQIASFEANQDMVDNFVLELANTTPERLIAQTKNQWKKYLVTDSLATMVSVYKKNKLLNTLYVGQHLFPSKPNVNTQKLNTPTKTLYRVKGHEQVFQTNGLLAFYTWEVNSWKKKEERELDVEKSDEKSSLDEKEDKVETE